MSTRVPGERAVSPVIGSVLLVLVTILLAAIVGTTVVGSTGMDGDVMSRPVAVSATADESGRITLTHEGGDPIHVDDVAVTVAVDGEPLTSQPPVPFFSASGFEPGPTGPFNSASDDRWTVGETGEFVLAETNEPTLTTGSTVEIQITRDGHLLASAETSVAGRPGDGDEG